MNWLEMASSETDNTHLTGIESSVAIEELNESLTEKIEMTRTRYLKNFHANWEKKSNN